LKMISSGQTINNTLSSTFAASSSHMEMLLNITQGNQQHRDELASELAIYLLENPEKTYDAICKKYFDYLLIRMAKNQYSSSTSYFYKQRIQDSNPIEAYDDVDEDDIQYKIELESKFEWLEEAKESLSWYQAQMYNEYFVNGKTYREIEDDYKLPLTSVYLTIKGIKEKIQKQK